MAQTPINQAGYHSEDMCHKPNIQSSSEAGILACSVSTGRHGCRPQFVVVPSIGREHWRWFAGLKYGQSSGRAGIREMHNCRTIERDCLLRICAIGSSVRQVNSGAGILLCRRRSNLASMALAPINQAGYHSEDMCHKPNTQSSRGAGIHCIL